MNTVRLLLQSGAGTVLVGRDGPFSLPVVPLPAAPRLAVLTQHWCRHRHIDGTFLATIGGLGHRDGSVDWGVFMAVDAYPDRYRAVPIETLARNAVDPVDRRLTSALIETV